MAGQGGQDRHERVEQGMETTRTVLVTLASAALLGLTACGNAQDPAGPGDSRYERSGESSASPSAGSSSSSSESSSSSSSSSTSGSSSSSAGDSVLAAIAAAEAEAGGTAYEVDEEGGGAWRIDVAKGDRSVAVDVAGDGTATSGREGDIDAEDKAGLDAAKVDLGRAVETALRATPGTLDGAELEEEGGTHRWKISIRTDQGDDTDVLVDVRSGKATPERDG